MVSENYPVSIIKIDVQGNELDVLKGSLNTIKKDRPALIIEIEEKFFSNPVRNRAEIAKIFKEFGYKCFLQRRSRKIPSYRFKISLRERYLSNFS